MKYKHQTLSLCNVL